MGMSAMWTVSQLEDHILEHYTGTAAQAEADGKHAAIIAADDQAIQHLRNLGWSDIAIGAYLVVDMLVDSGMCRETEVCPAACMCAAVYSFGGKVTGGHHSG